MLDLRSYLGAGLAAAALLILLMVGSRGGSPPPAESLIGNKAGEAHGSVGVLPEGAAVGLSSSVCPNLPVRWRLGELDPRFGLSSEEAGRAVDRAGAIWEEILGRSLFLEVPDPDGPGDGPVSPVEVGPGAEAPAVTIRFIHDERLVLGEGLEVRDDSVRRLEAGAYRTLTIRGSDSTTVIRREIRIYRFTDVAQLVRILAHEMGHTLELPHVEEGGFIMSPAFHALEVTPEVHPESLRRLERCLFEMSSPDPVSP